MKVNHKQMYSILKQQEKVLLNQLNPEKTEKVNEIPENFNQIGWDITVEKVESLLLKMNELRAAKGKLLTPQFYRSIYNRCLIATNEIEKMQESLSADTGSINYELESVNLISKIQELNKLLEESKATTITE